MATTTRCKVWDFSTAGDYTLGDDAAIASSALSLTDPAIALPWATHWDPEPSYDGNGDAILAHNQTYTAKTGGNDITMQDGTLVVQTAIHGTPIAYIVTFRGGTANSAAAVYSVAGLQVAAAGGDLEFAKYADDDFYEWRYKLVDAALRVCVTDGHENENYDRVIDPDAAGTITLKHTVDAGSTVTVGGGDNGSAAAPVLYYRRTGTCLLKEANAYTIPTGVESLGRLYAVADRAGGGTDVSFPVPLQYRLKTGTWGAWTTVAADGDMSAATIIAGSTQIQWRINDDNGVGLDNARDPRYVPTVDAIVLTYELTVPTFATEDSEMQTVMTNIAAAINGDGTVTAYDGWTDATYLFEHLDQPDLYSVCGVLIVPDKTEEHTTGTGKMVDNKPLRPKWYLHKLELQVWARRDTNTNDTYMDTAGLLALAADVRAALLTDPTLGDTVTELRINEHDIDALTRWYDEQWDDVAIVSISIEVQSKPFEGN